MIRCLINLVELFLQQVLSLLLIVQPQILVDSSLAFLQPQRSVLHLLLHEQGAISLQALGIGSKVIRRRTNFSSPALPTPFHQDLGDLDTGNLLVFIPTIDSGSAERLISSSKASRARGSACGFPHFRKRRTGFDSQTRTLHVCTMHTQTSLHLSSILAPVKFLSPSDDSRLCFSKKFFHAVLLP